MIKYLDLLSITFKKQKQNKTNRAVNKESIAEA